MKKLSKNALINIIAGVAAVVIAVAIIVPICVLSCGTKPTKYTVSFGGRFVFARSGRRDKQTVDGSHKGNVHVRRLVYRYDL